MTCDVYVRQFFFGYTRWLDVVVGIVNTCTCVRYVSTFEGVHWQRQP